MDPCHIPILLTCAPGAQSAPAARGADRRHDQVLIDALRRAHTMVHLDRQRLPTLANAPETQYERRLIRLAFLAPDLQADIVQGRRPALVNLQRLIEQPLPAGWAEQRALFEYIDCTNASKDVDAESAT